MKKTGIKAAAMLLGLLMTAVSIAGCSSQANGIPDQVTEGTDATAGETKVEEAGSEEAASQTPGEEDTITVVDDRGIEVTIPKKIDKVLISSILPLPSVYCLYRGGTTGLVGIHERSAAFLFVKGIP